MDANTKPFVVSAHGIIVPTTTLAQDLDAIEILYS